MDSRNTSADDKGKEPPSSEPHNLEIMSAEKSEIADVDESLAPTQIDGQADDGEYKREIEVKDFDDSSHMTKQATSEESQISKSVDGPVCDEAPSQPSCSPPIEAEKQGVTHPDTPQEPSPEKQGASQTDTQLEPSFSPPVETGEHGAIKESPNQGMKDTKNSATDGAVAKAKEKISIYHVKWINWTPSPNASTRSVGIITQNENGPCPLLSIVNVLLLRGKLSLPEDCEVISAEQLLEFLGEVLSDSVPVNLAEDSRLNYEQNMNDAICILPKLQTGLDVNVHFNGVANFEYTPDCLIFDLLNIPLYHGWLFDPQQEEICAAVNTLSYNQLVEKIIANKSSSDSELVGQSILAQQFLEETSSQLTYHGLYELNATLKDGELGVFFRNNHFSTIYKRKKELFLLVTDQGFLKEPRVVWETLNTIDGDILYVDENFMTVTLTDEEPESQESPQQAAGKHSDQIERDRQLAMSLSERWEDHGAATGLSDEELAKQLQEEENSLASQEQQMREGSQRGQSGQPGQSSNEARDVGRGDRSSPSHRDRNRSKSKNCAIL